MHHPTLRRRLTGVAAVVALATLVTACSGADDSAPSGSGNDAGGLEVTELTVGIVPVVDHAAVFQAIEAGYFEEVGLTVTAQPAQGGAAALPAMLAGDLQVAFATYPSFLLAQQNAAPVTIVGLGVQGTEDTAGVYVNPDSDIQTIEDLEGATIAVNTLNNTGDITIKALLEEAGVDPASVQFIELPFPDMLAAVQGGNVDAAWVVEPFQSSLLAADMRRVTPSYTGPTAGIPVSGLAMTTEFVTQNPNTAAAFAEAIQRANADLVANPDLARDLVLTYSEVPEAVAQSMSLPEWTEDLPSAEHLEIWNELMVQTGVLSEPVDLSQMLLSH